MKFLTFKEAHDRLQKSLFRGDEWRGCADQVHLLDVNNDGFVAANDVLMIINFINAHPAGEGEALGAVDALLLLGDSGAGQQRRRG